MTLPGDTLGRRLPDITWGAGTDDWDRCKCPGDYARVTRDGETVAWYVMTPNGHQGTLRRNHTVVEHDDRTITATPSILISLVGTDEGWHGWLTRGIWRSV